MTSVSNQGALIWITGLAGSGKTSIGKTVYATLKTQHPNAVFLDGNILRDIFGVEMLSQEDRDENAHAVAQLCKFLTGQGIHVVCATMSLFEDVRAFNRKHIHTYYEVFIDVSIKELKRRDHRQLYSRALSGDLDNVLGINVPFQRPEDCHLTINNEQLDNLKDKAQRILDLTGLVEPHRSPLG